MQRFAVAIQVLAHLGLLLTVVASPPTAQTLRSRWAALAAVLYGLPGAALGVLALSEGDMVLALGRAVFVVLLAATAWVVLRRGRPSRSDGPSSAGGPTTPVDAS